MLTSTSQKKILGFNPGDRIIYIPYLARGNVFHPFCQIGTVIRVTATYVYCKFDPPNDTLHGRRHHVGCDPNRLMKIDQGDQNA